MARPSKVWYWKSRKSYFCTIDGQRINLGKDKEGAEKAFYKMMATETIPEADISVAELLDKFLVWNEANRANETFKWYNKHLQAFLDTLTNPHMSASKLRPFHVNEWADKRDISSTYRRGSMVAVQRAFNWAAKQGYLESSPLANLEKPSAERREQCPTTEDYKFISQHIHGDFKDLIDFAWLTGIRPQEIFKLETKHYKNGRFEFTVKESKGKKVNRVVFITKEAKAIVERRKGEKYIFTNRDGGQWTAYSVSCRFARLEKKLGRKWCLTAFRHGFATRMLEAGLDHIVVAKLLGHTNGTMVARVYSHVGNNQDFLQKQLDSVG